MNSTKILFLKMLKGDIKRYVIEKNNNLSDSKGLLTGQTIGRSIIESFSSYKLMNEDERAMVKTILDEMKINENGNEKGKALLKHIDSLVPHSIENEVEYKDAS